MRAKEENQSRSFGHDVDASIVSQTLDHLYEIQCSGTFWLQTTLPYLKVTRQADNILSTKQLGCSVMSVSCPPMLAGVRDFRETFFELESRSSITDVQHRSFSVENTVT